MPSFPNWQNDGNPTKKKQKKKPAPFSSSFNKIQQHDHIITIHSRTAIGHLGRTRKKNHWITRAIDPAFSKDLLKKCHSLSELKDVFTNWGWCLGQGFYFCHLCFINQIDGGDEWLTIRNGLAFESISFIPVIKHSDFNDLIYRLLTATDEELQNLTY